MNKKPVFCNNRVLAHTATKLNEEPAIVKAVVFHYFEFIAKTIEQGAFEGVEIKHFGKIKAKLRYIQTINARMATPKPQVKRP